MTERICKSTKEVNAADNKSHKIVARICLRTDNTRARKYIEKTRAKDRRWQVVSL